MSENAAQDTNLTDIGARVTPTDLRQRLAQTLANARHDGADAAEVALSASRSLSVEVRAGQRETVESEDARAGEITVYCGQRAASAATADLSPAGLRDALTQALAMARFTEPDPYAGLADAALMATSWPELSLDHPWALDVDAAERHALAAESAALACDDRVVQSEGATVASEREVSAYGNSHDFAAANYHTHHVISCSAIARANGAMQRDVAFSQARDPADLERAAAVGARAAERAVARLGARTPPTTKAPVLFSARAARGLWQHLLAAISGGALYQNASFLKDRLGENVAAPIVTVVQSPHRPKGLASAGFDGDGVATAERVLIDAGVLNGYLLGAYSARRLGLTTTGNAGGVFNPEIHPGEDDFDALVAGMGGGLVVTELMGQGVNLTTGDYSRGAAGFWVENGEIAYPVENATVAGNLASMYRDIEALGSDVDTSSTLRTPSVLIGRMTVAGGNG